MPYTLYGRGNELLNLQPKVTEVKGHTAELYVLPVRHLSGGFEVRNNIALTVTVCIATFKTIGIKTSNGKIASLKCRSIYLKRTHG